MDLSDTFLAARDKIREQGWTRGVLQDDHGRFCLRGAVVSLFDLEEGTEAVRGMGRAVDELDLYCLFTFSSTTVDVNDAHLQSAEEAVDVLEGAAKWTSEGKKHGAE